MADFVIGMNRGQHLADVISSTATMNLDLEVTVDLAANRTRQEVLDGLSILEQAIFDIRASPFAK